MPEKIQNILYQNRQKEAVSISFPARKTQEKKVEMGRANDATQSGKETRWTKVSWEVLSKNRYEGSKQTKRGVRDLVAACVGSERKS